jgi:alginate O-acetyltransferase complex protein AlgI
MIRQEAKVSFMLFNSYGFLFVFLPFSLLCTRWLRGQMLLRCLTLLSFFFYSFAGQAWFVLPMLFTTCMDFLLAKPMAARQGGGRKAILILSLGLNLGLLGYFKYSGLLFGTPGLLPAGISFYTFQTMSYMIDVYRGNSKAEEKFFAFAAFVSFFPHLVAGPLTRHDQLVPQLKEAAATGIKPDWDSGLQLLCLGLAKKVLLGDSLASAFKAVFIRFPEQGMLTAWLALAAFSLQIYFDFSGYSDMALGLGRFFGIELPVNFNAPYRSSDPRDFWRRWHMTLSRWLRDYLYIPLGGNRCSSLRQDFNLFLTMLLGGLWHGGSLLFAAWGAYHGLLLLTQKHAEGLWKRLKPGWGTALNLVLICLGWVFFRSKDMSMAWDWFGGLAGLKGPGLGFFLALQEEHLRLLAWTGLAALIAAFCPEPWQLPKPSSGLAWAGLGLLAALSVSMLYRSEPFLYFQF